MAIKFTHGSAVHCTVQYYTTLCYTVLHCIILHYTTLYYTILHYTTLYYTILYYTIVFILYYTFRSSSPTVCVGQEDSSPGSIRPASGIEPEDPVNNRTLDVKTDTGLVEKDGREAKYITDVIPRKMSSKNIASTKSASTKSSSNMVGGISKTVSFQSGKKMPFRSRMPDSSDDSKSHQKEESDSQAGVKTREEEAEEEEIVGIEGRSNGNSAQEKET